MIFNRFHFLDKLTDGFATEKRKKIDKIVDFNEGKTMITRNLMNLLEWIFLMVDTKNETLQKCEYIFFNGEE